MPKVKRDRIISRPKPRALIQLVVQQFKNAVQRHLTDNSRNDDSAVILET